MILFVLLGLLLFGCDVSHKLGISEQVPSQSWDQEHLKAHDIGCPTAVYIVGPDGLLEQC